ncbi:MAG: tetratricopeptide repeat protein [Gemmatimonadota bacterium]
MGPTADPVERQAESLARQGQWGEVYALLSSLDREALLGQGPQAYRYGEALYHTGRMEELASFAADLEEAARAESDILGLMKAINLGGIAAFELGRTRAAERRFESLMELAESESDREMMARAATNIGAVANLRGDPEKALQHYHLAAPLYEKLRHVRGLAQIHHNLGISYRDMDRLEDSVTSYLRAAMLAAGIDYQPLVAMATIGRAEAELRSGDASLCAVLVERGLEEARQVGDPISEAEALRVRGLARAAVHPAKARADLEEAVRLAQQTGNSLLEAEGKRDLGRLLLGEGDGREGVGLLNEAAEMFRTLGAEAEVARLEEELAGGGA